MQFLYSPSTDPFYNIALEEYLLKHSKANILLCYINRPSLVLGRFQVPYREVDVKLMEEEGVTLVRRPSGGGTVFHDSGNLNYAFIHNCDEQEGDAYDFFNQKTLAILQSLGLTELSFERNNIFCQSKKISGVAQYKRGERMVHHGTLLVEADLPLLRRLFVKKDYYVSKGIPSVSSSVSNISEFVEVGMASVLDAFERTCTATYASEIDVQSIADSAKAYAVDEWVVDRSPNYSLQRNGLELDIKKGKMIAVNDEALQALVGHRHRFSEVLQVILDKGVKCSPEELF